MLETLYASGANLMILPIQDVFGWRDRINTPATVGDDNWTWRLPWASDRLFAEPGQWVSPASFASGQSGTAASTVSRGPRSGPTCPSASPSC